MTDVSVIIAAYRAEDTVRRAVESALASTGVSVEVIVADDASPDGTAAAAEGSTVVRLAENGGPGAARNAALDAARGRFVAVLDADDTMAPDRLARLVARADAENADIVLDNLLVDGASVFPPRVAALSPLSLATFVRGNHPFGRGPALGYAKPLLRRDFVERHGLRYDPALRIGEDYLLVADALALGARCIVEATPGYHYTRREGSISARLAPHHLAAMREADDRFAARHHLDPAAASALAERTAALDTATAFLAAVDRLKARRPAAAAAIVARRPRALWHFRLPLLARLQRLRAA